jgi:predicted transcriptional regulator
MGATSVRLQPEIEEGLEAVTSALHRSKDWVINRALWEFLERRDLDPARGEETLAAMESVARGKEAPG